MIGSLQDRDLLDRVFKNPDALHEDVATAMQPPLSAIDIEQSVDEVFAALTGRVERGRGRARRPAGRRAHALRPARVPRAQPGLVPLQVMLPRFWVVSTKPEAALALGKACQPW